MKMLVVDDEHDVEQLFRQIFRKEIKSGQLEIVFLFSAMDAIEFMDTLTPMDVILLLSDINMPEMTGFDLLEVALRMFPYLNIYMVSAYGDEFNINKATTLGAKGFFTKPLDIDKLKSLIASYQTHTNQ